MYWRWKSDGGRFSRKYESAEKNNSLLRFANQVFILTRLQRQFDA
jgi:hypothetical protein